MGNISYLLLHDCLRLDAIHVLRGPGFKFSQKYERRGRKARKFKALKNLHIHVIPVLLQAFGCQSRATDETFVFISI